MERKKRLVVIEKMIDESSVSELLEDIGTICHEKSQHIYENWQDPDAAHIWRKAGNKIFKCVDSL